MGVLSVLSSNLAGLLFLLGLLLFSRSNTRGLGWLFPYSTLMVCAAIVKIMTVFIVSGSVLNVPIDLRHAATSQELLADTMLLTGLGLSAIRLHLRILTNSVLTWGWMLSIAGMCSVFIIYFAAKRMVLLPCCSQNLYWLLVAVCGVSVYVFRHIVPMWMSAGLQLMSMVFAGLSENPFDVSQFVSIGFEGLSYLLLLLFVVIHEDGLYPPRSYVDLPVTKLHQGRADR